MSQQSPMHNEDMTYKKSLFYDNGVRYVPVRAKAIQEYKPPSPILKSNVHQTVKSSAALVQNGTSHYATTLTLLFYSKKEYADWLQFIGSEHKYYDEKGSIYVGIVDGEINIQPVAQETKYIITVNLVLVRKQEFEFRHKAPFIDIDKHWAKTYIDEMQKRGLVAVYGYDGQPVQYFRPNDSLTRAEGTAFLVRTYKYIDKILRGY